VTDPGVEQRPAAHVAARVGSWADDWWQGLAPRTRQAIRIASPIAVLATAAGTRLWDLGHPAELVFDETYYVKDAWSSWNLGYESRWPDDPNPRFAEGETDIYTGKASFAVHPPLGKWVIALGMAAFGPMPSWTWRISTAIVGILLVGLIMLVAHRLTKSLFLATLAGGVLAIDGNGIVMSRMGLLDGILAFFLLLGFWFFLKDWESRRLREIQRQSASEESGAPPSGVGAALWARPWLIAAGAAFGAASAVKWSGLWFLVVFGLLSVVADRAALRSFGGFLARGLVNFTLFIPAALAVYLATWIPWFATEDGYHRQWAEDPANTWTGPFAWVPKPIQSWLHLEQSVYEYHVGENRPHDYQAPAWMWLLLARPTSFYYRSSELGDPGCDATSCGASILDIANPLIWWASVVALVWLIVRFWKRLDWPSGLVLAGFAAGYLPWLAYVDRTIFAFYTIAFEPFLLLALVLAIGDLLGSPGDDRSRRTIRVNLLAVFLGLAVAISVYFWPVWTGMVMPYDFVASHWWLPSWR